MDDLDRKILNILQTDFPLAPTPFAEIGAGLGVPSGEVLERVRRLKEEKVIRQVSAIFDSRALGYTGSLVAAAVEPLKLHDVAAAVSSFPSVSHNYAREHKYNLWFTVTVPPRRTVEQEAADIAAEAGIEKYLLLPALRVFKIGYTLDMVGDSNQGPSSIDEADSPVERTAAPLCASDIRLVRVLQRDIPLVDHPFATAATEAGLTEEALLAEAQRFIDTGVMRRFAAVLRQHKAGFSANGMGIWRAQRHEVERIGWIMAGFPEVSHCYERPTYPDWPYNLFTMIHATSRDKCEKVAKEISERTGIKDYSLLFSTKEFKKVRVKYFEEAADANQ